MMLNNNDLKGDFASIQNALPNLIQFEYKNINDTKNTAVADTD